MTASIAASVTLLALRKPLQDLYDSARETIKHKLTAALVDSKIKEIHKAIRDVQMVKTMWRIGEDVKLATFYYPSKLQVSGKAKVINSLDDIPGQKQVVIRGTVGQGKSIFLRYLCMRELAAAQRIPIFVELRRYDKKEKFLDFLMNSVKLYKLPCDEDVFGHLAESGKVALLLDGFDEIEGDVVAHVLEKLEELIKLYRDLPIVVTSRPYSSIEDSARFRLIDFSPLTADDHRKFLERIIKQPEVVDEVLSAINTSTSDVRSLLTTPLLMTLLVLVYIGTHNVPKTLSQFYEELFFTLLIRHDQRKSGLRRQRESELSNWELRKLFEAFSYAARQANTLEIDRAGLAKMLERASNVTTIRCDPDAFSSDITKVACLMQTDGFTYRFIHKSVAEFHAACFICRVSDENAKRFYAGLKDGRCTAWRQELRFLNQIDHLRYLKYFYIPSVQRLKSYGIDILETRAIGDANTRRVLNSIRLQLNDDDDDVTFSIVGHTVVADEIISAIARAVRDDQNSLSWQSAHGYGQLGNYLADQGQLEFGKRAIARVYSSVREQLTCAQREIELSSTEADFISP